uniref:NADH-ubiquinone oxidoreductase chain 4 n=1 Tax=Panthalis oerstedi TaxID=318815 RepID=A0A343W6D9_9ANNE|nr:NADH dehydrogenase subunit 4 [Panthalis oerstedi]
MLTLLFVTLALILLTPFYRQQYLWPSLCSGTLLMSTVSLNLAFAPFPHTCATFGPLQTDPMSAALIALSIWISALMIMASSKIPQTKQNPRLFLLTLLSLTATLTLAFSVTSLMSFYIMFEASLIPTLLLILGWGYQPERLQAGMYLMMYTISASLPLLINILLISASSGHTSFILSHMSTIPVSPSMAHLWWLTVIPALLVKMPMYITHLWLPKAHVEAPVSGSMVLAAILLKLGSYGLLRVSSFFPSLMFSVSPLTNSVAMWGATVTSMICLRQSDLKSLIAYSSIGHMALVIMGTSLLSHWGWQGALAMMIAHGLCSSCLFALSNMTYETSNTRAMFITKGLLTMFPAFSMWWFILSIANMAAPPSINLFSEIALIMSAIWASPAYMPLVAMCCFLAAAYSLHLYSSINHGPIPLFSNPLNLLTNRNHTTCLLHAAPIFLLISKTDVLSSWF